MKQAKKKISLPSLHYAKTDPLPVVISQTNSGSHSTQTGTFDGKIMKPRSKVEQREQLLPVKAGEENRN